MPSYVEPSTSWTSPAGTSRLSTIWVVPVTYDSSVYAPERLPGAYSMTLSTYSKLLALPVPLMANPWLCSAAAAAAAAPFPPKPFSTSTSTSAGETVATTAEPDGAADAEEPDVVLVPDGPVVEVVDVGVALPPGDEEEEADDGWDEEAGAGEVVDVDEGACVVGKWPPRDVPVGELEKPPASANAARTKSRSEAAPDETITALSRGVRRRR